jgi:predicted TIM-barrel fold metal-dependent hydrolase
MGDQDINIATARPGLLGEVFRDHRLRHAKIILLHGSYPYYEEGAYLANVFPNVYLDLSLFNPWIGYESITRVMATVLDVAPFTKLLYASDAYGSPEMQWLAGKYGRSALASALDAAITAGLLPAGEAKAAMCLILADNARALYDLASTESSSQ